MSKIFEDEFKMRMNLIEEKLIHDLASASEISIWSKIIWAAWHLGSEKWSPELRSLYAELLEMEEDRFDPIDHGGGFISHIMMSPQQKEKLLQDIREMKREITCKTLI